MWVVTPDVLVFAPNEQQDITLYNPGSFDISYVIKTTSPLHWNVKYSKGVVRPKTKLVVQILNISSGCEGKGLGKFRVEGRNPRHNFYDVRIISATFEQNNSGSISEFNVKRDFEYNRVIGGSTLRQRGLSQKNFSSSQLMHKRKESTNVNRIDNSRSYFGLTCYWIFPIFAGLSSVIFFCNQYSTPTTNFANPKLVKNAIVILIKSVIPLFEFSGTFKNMVDNSEINVKKNTIEKNLRNENTTFILQVIIISFLMGWFIAFLQTVLLPSLYVKVDDNPYNTKLSKLSKKNEETLNKSKQSDINSNCTSATSDEDFWIHPDDDDESS